MQVEVCEIEDDTITGNPELVVIVQSNTIFDLPRVLAHVDDHYPSLWDEWDRSRPIFAPPEPGSVARNAAREAGWRFLDYWHFERKAS